MTYFGECLKLREFAEKTKELHRYGGADYQQAHGEDNETAELLAGPEDLVHKPFQQRRRFYQSDNPENLSIDQYNLKP